MLKIINQYSYIWIVGLLVSILGLLFFRHGSKWPAWLFLLVIGFGLLLAWFSLRPQQTKLLSGAAQVRASIGLGKPVLLEFQSPY
jgi:hypothetical protein